MNYKIFDKKILIIKNNIATKAKKKKFRHKKWFLLNFIFKDKDEC